jgi:hypothetical protein
MSLQGAEMKTSRKCVLILINLAVYAASSTESSTPPFALTLEAEENPVKAGSEVNVDITLSNSSNRAMHMSYGLTESDYAFEVGDSQNRIPPETDREGVTSRMTTSFTYSQVRASQKHRWL